MSDQNVVVYVSETVYFSGSEGDVSLAIDLNPALIDRPDEDRYGIEQQITLTEAYGPLLKRF